MAGEDNFKCFKTSSEYPSADIANPISFLFMGSVQLIYWYVLCYSCGFISQKFAYLDQESANNNKSVTNGVSMKSSKAFNSSLWLHAW